MSDDQSTVKPVRARPRLMIGVVIVIVIAVTVVALAIARETSGAGGLLPILATPTLPNDVGEQTAVSVTFSELNADPLAFVNKQIQISGEYLTLEKPPCSRYSGPDLHWALVSEGLQLETKGFDRVVRILEPGTQMTVQGLWRLYQGPLGCGKGPATGNAWYLQAQKIIHPNPLVSSGSGNLLTIENVESSFPELLPTATFTATPTETPTQPPNTPTLTPTTIQIVPTVPVEATSTPDFPTAASPTLTPTSATGTPDGSTSTPGSPVSPTLEPTTDPGDGGGAATSTPEPPSLPTATEFPGGYPAPTDTPDPYT